jgi:alpha-beta hydrolase superfamily lysophospholipase
MVPKLGNKNMKLIILLIVFIIISCFTSAGLSEIHHIDKEKPSMNVSFESNDDRLVQMISGCRIYYKPLEQPVFVVEPADTPPRAVILFIHGIGEHSFRYFNLAIEWAQEGYQTLLFDLQGHGSGIAQTEIILELAREYLKELDSEKFIDTIKSRVDSDPVLFETIRNRNVKLLTKTRMEDHATQVFSIINALSSSGGGSKPLPFFVAGHSLGGVLAANVGWHIGMSGRYRLDGIILFSLALKPIPKPSGSFIESAVVKISWYSRQNVLFSPLGWIIRGLARLNLKESTHWVSDWISDLPQEKDLHRADPLILRTVPLSYLAEIEGLMAETIGKGIGYPVDAVIFVPLADRIVNAEGSINFGNALRSSRKTERNLLVTYPEFPYHELLRSSKRTETLQVMYRWLQAHI